MSLINEEAYKFVLSKQVNGYLISYIEFIEAYEKAKLDLADKQQKKTAQIFKDAMDKMIAKDNHLGVSENAISPSASLIQEVKNLVEKTKEAEKTFKEFPVFNVYIPQYVKKPFVIRNPQQYSKIVINPTTEENLTVEPLPELPEKYPDNTTDVECYLRLNSTNELYESFIQDFNQLITCLEAVYKRLGEKI